MGKILITIIVVIIVIFLFFFRGPEAGDIVDTDRDSSLEGFTNDPEDTDGDAMETEEPIADQTLAPSPEGTPADVSGNILDTSDWVTYSNEREGYSVKMHPWWWWRRDILTAQGTAAAAVVWFDENPVDLPLGEYTAPIAIQDLKRVNSLSEISSAESSVMQGKINGIDVVHTVSGPNPDDELFGTSTFYGAYFTNDGQQYRVLYHDTSSSGKYLDIYHTMVSTFEFN